VLVQGIAYYLFRSLGVSVPPLGKPASVFATLAVTGLTFFIVFLLQRGIDLQALTAKTDDTRVEALDRAGIVVAFVFSAVLATLTYLGSNQGGLAFVPWGVFFGVAIAGLKFDPDRLILGLLLFLAPGDAVTIYNLLQLGGRVEQTRGDLDVQIEKSNLTAEEDRLELETLANSLDEQMRSAQAAYVKDAIQRVIERLQSAATLSPEMRREAFAQARILISNLRSGRPVLSLPTTDTTGMPLAEKVNYHIGLSDAEIQTALAEGLIDGSQSHLWRPEVQDVLRMSLDDVRLERLVGKPPMYVTLTMEPDADIYKVALSTLAQLLVKQRSGELTVAPIKGELDNRIVEARFDTVTQTYSAILHRTERHSVLLALAALSAQRR